MKKYFGILLFVLPFSTFALNVTFKNISMKIPDSEVKTVAIVNIEGAGLQIDGEDWGFMFSDEQFKKHCYYVVPDVLGLKCEDKDMLALFDSLYKDTSQKAMTYLFAIFDDWKKLYPNGFEKAVFKSYIMYSLIPKKVTGSSYPHVVVLDKITGKISYMFGNFNKKQFDWINIEK
ncbi:MAG: hypothetical protein ACKE51_07675 [Methylococcaceae bacterium]